MEQWLIIQGSYLLRIVIAAACGAAIGYERQNRLKTAGIRTHIIVSMASALMMLVSKYGFMDIVGKEGIGLDPSRIAAGVVTAIGFLGAGIIFVHNQTVRGITTAAGIWATVGIGMAIGAGMYPIGVISAVLIILFQWLLHKNFFTLKMPIMEKIVFKIKPGTDEMPDYITKLKKRNITILDTAILRQSDGSIQVRLNVRFPKSYSAEDIMQLFMEEPFIESVEM